MTDGGALAVHRDGRARDRAAIGLANRLVAETDAEDRNLSSDIVDEVEANAGLMRGAWPGRKHDRIRPRRQHVGDAHLVVTVHIDTRALSPEIMHEVEGET